MQDKQYATDKEQGNYYKYKKQYWRVRYNFRNGKKIESDS